MAIWCRIQQSNLKCLSRQFRRCYFQIHGPCSAPNTASNTRIRVLNKPNLISPKGPTEFGSNVRCFAAPVQAKQKQEKRDAYGPRMNEQITAQIVRLISDEGNDIVSRHEALEYARKLKLDLVEVQRTANPPVCKIMDFHREKYKQKVKQKERAKSKSEGALKKGVCKEVRFSLKTELKDLKMKADMVKRLMERGYRVKCTAMGTEEQDLGGLLSQLFALIEDVSFVESVPRVEKKQAYVIVRHNKFGTTKKSPGKKASKAVGSTTAEAQKAAILPPNMSFSGLTQNPLCFEEDLNSAESGSEIEDEILPDEEEAPVSPLMGMPDENHEVNETTWSVVDAIDDLDQVFNFSNDRDMMESFHGEQMNNVAETPSSATYVSSSDILHPRPVVDSAGVNTVPSFLQTDNRYKRSVPNTRFSPTKSVDNKGLHVKESVRLEPQLPNQGRQPHLDLNNLPSTGDTKRVGTDASVFRNLKLPNEIPRQGPSHASTPSLPVSSFGIFSAPNQGKQPQSNLSGLPSTGDTKRVGSDACVFGNLRLPNENPTQGPSQPVTPSSAVSSYGIFSAQKSNAPGRQGVASEINKNKEESPTDFARHSASRGVSANPNLPPSKSDHNQRPGIDRSGQGKWGIFSGEGSNVIPKRTSDSQAKVQR